MEMKRIVMGTTAALALAGGAAGPAMADTMFSVPGPNILTEISQPGTGDTGDSGGETATNPGTSDGTGATDTGDSGGETATNPGTSDGTGATDTGNSGGTVNNPGTTETPSDPSTTNPGTSEGTGATDTGNSGGTVNNPGTTEAPVAPEATAPSGGTTVTPGTEDPSVTQDDFSGSTDNMPTQDSSVTPPAAEYQGEAQLGTPEAAPAPDGPVTPEKSLPVTGLDLTTAAVAAGSLAVLGAMGSAFVASQRKAFLS